MSAIHVMHEGRGDSWTLYLGRRKGARYFDVDVRGFNGWSSTPRWLPGGWQFYNPRLGTGRLGMDRHRTWSPGEIKLPSTLVEFYRWKVRPSGRRYMREHGRAVPVPSLGTPDPRRPK